MLQPTDPRVLRTHACEAEPRAAALIDTAASVVAALVLAHARGDAEAAAGELGRLVNAVAKYTAALAERPSDEPLRRAIARL